MRKKQYFGRKSEKIGESQRNLGESQRTLGENKEKFYKLKVDRENLREKTPIL